MIEFLLEKPNLLSSGQNMFFIFVTYHKKIVPAINKNNI